MLFNSLQYFVFLGVVLAVYARLRHRGQNLFLLGASYVFYATWDYRFLTLIWISTAVDFLAGRGIHRSLERGDDRSARRWLWLSLGVNLGMLGFFKYFGFFVESARELLELLGLPVHTGTLSIILPVGISFYTFQTLSYTIDIYRRRIEPVDSLPDFALFVAYFPQLVAGPIERAATLLPQIGADRQVTRDDRVEGANLIVMGLFRKVVIADTAAFWVDRIFAEPSSYSSLQLGAGLFLYALQIYGDFSGYSNIARGTSRLFGISLMRNFHHPYFATTIEEFWHRWHISLSTWLKDYLYIPLGGSRRGALRTQVNLMITMLLGGLWHGASWNFVIWGGLHGLYLAAHRPFRRGRDEPDERGLGRRLASMALVFALVTFTWLFFRSTELAITIDYLQGLASLSLGGGKILLPCLALALLMLAIDIPQARRDDEHFLLRLPLAARGLAFATMLVLLLFSGGSTEPFIYFQF